jgi:hypothetical protein
MRFIADGPSIPDELLISRDMGDVIFFCGAGVSQANARLPNFEGLGRDVLRLLGAAQDSPARKLLDKALEMGRMAGVGGLLATDRVFGLLEQEFEVADVRAAVAEAIKPPAGYALKAHRIMLDLATSRAGITRLVTTNFDLLFEECDPSLPCSGPPRLPDPRNDRDFRGIVHLHGRVDPYYRYPQDDEFVVSSADFGRAYLTDGWATQFIQSLLSRYQIVFVGYTADDPPVQYLLEALNLRAGSKSRLFAFQEGESSAAAALWEHKGVQAIPFDGANGFAALWNTLAAWADRARDVDGWYAGLLSKAAAGPATLDAHVRGQIAHVVSTREGARRISMAQTALDASWLLTFDPQHRYGAPDRTDPYDEASDLFEPFAALGLDLDIPPEPANPDDTLAQRTVFNKRTVPDNAWDAFASSRFDVEESGEQALGSIRGPASGAAAALPPRLASIGIWMQRVAHLPVAVWWAAQETALHPAIRQHIESSLLQEPLRFSDGIRRGWRLLLAAWADERRDPNMLHYEIQARTKQEGWTQSLIRRLVALYRPRLTVKQTFGVRHPLLWTEGKIPEKIIHVDIDYPRPHEDLHIPDEHLAYAIDQFRGNLQLAISLEREITGHDQLHFETSRDDDVGPELPNDSYGLTGPIVQFQKLMQRWAALDPSAARNEVMGWPTADHYIFARLRIWAAGNAVLTPSESAQIFLTLPDVVFWGSLHERDLLYALRDRWAELSADAKLALEDRLRKGSFPWPEEVHGGRDRAIAHDRLSRLYWLSSHGVAFSFDLAAENAKLRAAAPEWTTEAGDEAANSRAPVVFDVKTDESAEPLLETPISEILTLAQEAGSFDFIGRVQREPFRGFSTRRPSRALGALTHAARQGQAPRWAWSELLHADGRLTDTARMIGAIARRLERLPVNLLGEIAYPVTEWMERIADRLYGDAGQSLDGLWNRIIEALTTKGSQPRRHQPDRSWADDALNAPVGKLVNLLMKDPTKNGLKLGAGYPRHWTARASQLLGLPGDLRRQALVMISFQTVWLFAIDPAWTQQQLLPCSNDPGDDGDAFWGGVLWAAKIPSPDLFLRLKSGLIGRAVQPRPRRGHDTILAGLLLAGWGGDPDDEEPARLVTDVELREVLIHTDDDLRGRLIWQLAQWSSERNGRWRKRVIPFLTHVWPKQRSLRTPGISARLTDFALASGELMPEIVKLISPRLVPIRGPALSMLASKADSEDYPPRRHPRATLDLLWAVLAEDPALWPYRIEVVLAQLEQIPETSADPRLSELRRRRER